MLGQSNQAFGFLRQAGLFQSLGDEQLRALWASGESMSCGPGHLVVEEGSPASDLFLVKSGVLEARRLVDGASQLVGYIFPGECIGEMSILTGSPRSATVRVPERAELFRVPGLVFMKVLRADPEVAIGVARALALRLERQNREQPEATSTVRQLAGDLQYFDVAEVCQTMIQSRRTGVLSLSAPPVGGDAKLYFEEGLIRHARAGELIGHDAALFLLRTKLSGRFEFRGTATYPGPTDAVDIADGSMGLLLEAAQQRDEIEHLQERLPKLDHVFTRVSDADVLSGPLVPASEDGSLEATRGRWRPSSEEERMFARQVLASLAAGESLGRLITRDVPHERDILAIALMLVRAGIIQ
ncbi:MAG: cyclic nucleotide-binding domain-containing protein [Myxococcota bacterium]